MQCHNADRLWSENENHCLLAGEIGSINENQKSYENEYK